MTEDVIAYFNKQTGKDSDSNFDQYLRHAARPVLELKLTKQGRGRLSLKRR